MSRHRDALEKSVLYDGEKSVPLSRLPEAAWTKVGGDRSGGKAQTAYQSVAWLHKAVTLRSAAVQSMPFRIFEGENVIDDSTDYQNTVGFFPDIKKQLNLIEASLTLTGRAYQHHGVNAFNLTKLKYLSPVSIIPEFDDSTGELLRFVRLGNRSTSEELTEEDIIHFWNPDPFVEQGPPLQSPVTAALAAAGVLMSVDEFSAKYFERGAIKATILAVSGGDAKSQKELATWWKRVVTGINNAFASRVIQADSIKPTIIGEGLEELNSKELTDSRREDISTALGVPQSKLFSNAANFATKQSDNQDFIADTITPEVDFIAEVWNEQLFEHHGYKIKFYPEELSVMQVEENQRSQSLANMTTAGVPTIPAMEMLGYDLPGDMTFEELQQIIDDQPAPMPQGFGAIPPQREDEPEEEEDNNTRTARENAEWDAMAKKTGGVVMEWKKEEEDEEEDEEDKSFHEKFMDPARTDLDRWKRKALKSFKADKGAAVEYTYKGKQEKHISERLRTEVYLALKYADNLQDIIDIFDEANGDEYKGKLLSAQLMQGYDQLREVAKNGDA